METPCATRLKWKRLVLPFTYTLVIAAWIAAVVRFKSTNSETTERHVVAWFVAALFVGIAIPLSVADIMSHLTHYVSPLQRFYIRILWLVPIYGVNCWLALRFKEVELYINTLREMYEAYVIFSFYSLLAEFVGPRERTLRLLEEKTARTGESRAHMLPPCCCLRPWRLDGDFISRTRSGTLQYVIVRIVLTAAIFIVSLRGDYNEGDFKDFTGLYVWGVIIMNASQLCAMWSLIMFYHELKEELSPLSPLAKFLAVKAIVFFAFWQKIIISALAYANVIQPTLDWTKGEIGVGLQDFIICIEMAVAAVVHRRYFSYRDFWRGENDDTAPMRSAIEVDAKPARISAGLVAMLPTDVIAEVAIAAGAAVGLSSANVSEATNLTADHPE